ncbi:hypothetical protein Tco_1173906 [Tanacetum coccineum]
MRCADQPGSRIRLLSSFDLSCVKEKERYKVDIRATNILLQATVQDRRELWFIDVRRNDTMRINKETISVGTMQEDYYSVELWRSGTEDSDYFKDKMLLMQAQENGAVLDEEQLLFLAGEQVTNFDDDVDDPPEKDLALNVDLSCVADHVSQSTMNAGPSYDSSNTPFEYNQYIEDNEEHVVQSNLSSVRNDAMMSIIDDMHEQGVQSMSANKQVLTRAKQVQSALYNGTEIVMTNHKPVVVHDSEETLEIAELTRKRMYEKMKSPQCIQNKVKFAPPDYSKENYLAIFAPQRDLTPEQIF